jgi:hypothetical protein
MLLYAEQPTPPFNSPYQSRESLYASPPRHDSRKYPEGLGLYDFPQPLTSALPPSPQASESWNGHMSDHVSPLMTESIADPWISGAFEHPVSRSPIPWASAHTSPRSSLSSCTRELSVFSHESSEHTYPSVKVEYAPWAPDMRLGPGESTTMQRLSSPHPSPLTVAPEGLSAGMYPYDSAYGPPSMSKFEPTPMYDYHGRHFEREPSEDSNGSSNSKPRSNYSSTSVPRERARNLRHTDPMNAAYRCHLCPEKGFARRYNYNQHMLTHDVSRRKDNVCQYPMCGKEFVRKTDLARHDQSVHQKSKPFGCAKCPQAFSRKDTLRR